MPTIVRVKVKGRWYDVEVTDLSASPVKALVDGEPVEVHLGEPVESPPPDAAEVSAPQPAVAVPPAEVALQPDAPTTTTPTHPAAVAKSFTSPMPGIVISVSVGVGDQVVTGDEVCILEAMKMQQALRAEWSGVVSAVYVEPGQQVLGGDPILDLE